MSNGEAQESRLVQYLMRHGYSDIVRGIDAVKKEAGLPNWLTCKSADVIAFLPNKSFCRQIIIAESKGTGVARSILQLGNTAAAVMERFGLDKEIRLLLYRSRLTQEEAGLSPGHGYLVHATTKHQLYTLIEATSSEPKIARAKCEIAGELSRWNLKLQQMVIEVCVE